MAFTSEAIERGRVATAQAVIAIHHAISRIFQETKEHGACLRLFKLTLLGFVGPDEELFKVVDQATEKAEVEMKKTRAIEEGAGRKEKRKAGTRR